MNSYNVNTNSLFWLSVFCLVISLSFKVVLEIKFYHQIVNSYYQILKSTYIINTTFTAIYRV